MRARWYDPIERRFISQDPAGASANGYTFAGNDAINGSDPTGMDPCLGDGADDDLVCVDGGAGETGGDYGALNTGTPGSNDDDILCTGNGASCLAEAQNYLEGNTMAFMGDADATYGEGDPTADAAGLGQQFPANACMAPGVYVTGWTILNGLASHLAVATIGNDGTTTFYELEGWGDPNHLSNYIYAGATPAYGNAGEAVSASQWASVGPASAIPAIQQSVLSSNALYSGLPYIPFLPTNSNGYASSIVCGAGLRMPSNSRWPSTLGAYGSLC